MNVEMSLKEALIKYLGQNDFLAKELYYIEVGDSNQTRIYYKPTIETDMGFSFVVVRGVSETVDLHCHVSKLGWNWYMNETYVEVLVNGIAHSDGLRHIYFGDEHNNGYIYIPDMKDLSESLNIVNELSYLHCDVHRLDFKVFCINDGNMIRTFASHLMYIAEDSKMFEDAKNTFTNAVNTNEQTIMAFVKKYITKKELFVDNEYIPNKEKLQRVNWNMEGVKEVLVKKFNDIYTPTLHHS